MTSNAGRYSAERITRDDIEIVRLYDSGSQTEVLIAPSVGNNAYQMTVKGKRVFWSPVSSVREFKARRSFAGNPFLEPWANRLDQDAFYANGVRYALNPELKNYSRDANGKPIHGLLAYAPEWQVIRVHAGADSAEVTSRLDFARYPRYMAQFPFAHSIEMTYRLSGTELQVETAIHNQSSEPMPLAIGFHPYFQVNDAPRDEWTLHIAAKEHVLLSNVLIPTGERKPVSGPDPVSLKDNRLDDVYTSLIRGDDGRAEFRVKGRREQITVAYGPKYQVAVVYAPPGKDFVCFEPMTGLTNAFNLHHAGLYPELQSIPPGATWEESFWIRATGF